MACGILALPPGIEPEFLTLEGGFLTNGSSGKVPKIIFLVGKLIWIFLDSKARFAKTFNTEPCL